jgi:uncharacterized protein YutD
MSRPKKKLFEVKKSGVPNGTKYWYIIGRPNGKRIRAWFDSEAEAKAEAKKQNSQLEDYIVLRVLFFPRASEHRPRKQFAF